jgi:single-strand DNA-binding protein
MRGINRVMLAGHLGAKPEMLKSNTGKEFTYISLATQRSVKKDEKWDYDTDWHSVQVWGRDAQFCVNHLETGDAVFVDGVLSHYKKQDEKGGTSYITSVKAKKIERLKAKAAPAASEVPAAPF